MSLVLDNYYNKLPFRPYCTDNFIRDGLYKEEKEKAIQKTYIQHNNKVMLNHIVLDIDRPFDFEYDQYENIYPAPNFQVKNPLNGHVHLVFSLDKSICKSNAARLKPLRFFSSIEHGLTDLFLADRAYAGLVSKNAFSQNHNVKVFKDELYQLSDLSEFIYNLDEINALQKEPKNAIGVGRNCSLFNEVRVYAYKQRFLFNYLVDFYNHLLNKSFEVNEQFITALDAKEVEQTTMSIAKWTWRNFTIFTRNELIARTHTRELQQIRNLKSQEKRRSKKEELKEKIKLDLLRNTNITQVQLSEKYNITTRTIRTYLKELNEEQ